MKHSSKLFSLCFYAAMGISLQGCGPETLIIGMVLDNQTGTTVPGTAVLGIVWIEDADKALPVPDTKNIKSEDRDTVLDKDTKDRGLPVAYARSFTDSNGRFELNNFHFSAATKKAVKAMKQPKITRVTMWAFQKGYRKQAVTMFPKNHKKEIPAATMLLDKPADWKELYVDNIVDTLTQDYMLKGYSKEFGATKAEKSWIFEYTRANEQRAYDISDIKNDKKMEEMCGRDYSDIIVSTAGIQRNPAREKCGELIKRIGAIYDVEELWLAHSNMKQDPLAAAKEAVRQALNALSAETAEPKEYEVAIFAGLESAGKTQSKDVMRNGVSGNAWQDEAKLMYGKGHKAAAYRALGYALYNQLPEEIRKGVITAHLPARAIPGIKETAAGFYLLMTRPLTAQLPNGDNDNHKDKPGYKVEAATEAASKEDRTPKPITDNSLKNNDADGDTVEIGGDKIRLKALHEAFEGEVIESREEEATDDTGLPQRKHVERRFFANQGADYVLRSHSVLNGRGDENIGFFEKSAFELFDVKGNKFFEKELGNRDFKQAWIFRNGTSVLCTNEYRDLGENIFRYEIYDNKGNLVNEITNTAGMGDWQIEGYRIANGMYIEQFKMSPKADIVIFTVKVSDKKHKLKKLEASGILTDIANVSGNSISVIVKSANKFFVFDEEESEKTAFSGKKYRKKHITLFRDSTLQWKITLEAESFMANYGGWSNTDKYLISGYQNEITWERNRLITWKEYYKVIDTSTGKIVSEGLRDDVVIKQYKAELLSK